MVAWHYNKLPIFVCTPDPLPAISCHSIQTPSAP
jgi:hypothetical protein